MLDLGKRLSAGWRRISLGLRHVNDGWCVLGHWPSERSTSHVIAALIVVWSVYCSIVLIPTGHFTYDQAYFYEESVRAAESLRWPAYGPFVSGVHPSPLTPGGMMYVVLSVPFLVFRDPRIGLGWIHVLVALGAWLFERALRKLEVAAPIRLATLALYVLSVAHARAVETFWNGDLFLFITPMLLYLAATMLARPSGLWAYFAFGATASLSTQTHLSGGMGVMMCLAIVLLIRPRALHLTGLVTIAVSFVACYAPYFIHEAAHGSPNAELLRKAVPHEAQLSHEALLRCLVSPILYTSHLENRAQLFQFYTREWVVWSAVISGWAAAALSVLGLIVRNPMKLWGCAVVLALPMYFRLTGREYYDHYVATVIPFVCLIPGGGLGWMLSRAPRFRVPALSYLLLYATASFAIMLAELKTPVLHPVMPWNGMNVAVQLERTQEDLDRGEPVHSHSGDDDALIRSILARRVLGKELSFKVNKRRCKAEIYLSGFAPPPTDRLTLRLGNNSVFVCE